VMVAILVMTVFACKSEAEKKAAFLEKGKNYVKEGKFKNAELEFRNAIQIDPNFLEAYSGLAEAYLKMGDPQGAWRWSQKFEQCGSRVGNRFRL